jgi:hypothetical protein
MITDAGRRAMRKQGGPTLEELRAAGGYIARRYDSTAGKFVVEQRGKPTRVNPAPRSTKRARTDAERAAIVAEARRELEAYRLAWQRELARDREDQARRDYDRRRH